MTDKQIIIDGVDVSGCSELYNGCCCDNGSFYCKDQPNCKFKLEKRGYKLEQITEFTPREELLETITHLRVLNAELESYNEQLKESQNIEIKENKILREQLKHKEQECEELKSKNNYSPEVLKQCPHYKNDNVCTYLGYETKCEGDCNYTAFQDFIAEIDDLKNVNSKLQQQIDQLETENGELKKWQETVVELFERTCRCKYLNEKNNHCSFYNRNCIGRLNQCLYKNQQTLTEIKEIAEKMKKLSEEDGGELTECFFRDKQCEKCSEDKCLPYWFAQILQKISECEGNNE